MNDSVIKELYDIICQRKKEYIEGSYTCYLFEKGIDKILKKCGEECAELIIASKNNDNAETVNEACDLIYHMLVLLANQGVAAEDIFAELSKRAEKQKNLKQFKTTDKNT